MGAEHNLELLMARYQQGDFAAATSLIEGISPQLLRFFSAQQASRPDADDLLQETWLRIHKVRHTYRPGEPALPWFYAIARHVRIDHHRKLARISVGERELEVASRSAPPQAGDAGRSDGIDALLAPLSASEREVLEMLKVTGMSLDEVARATSSTVGSVKQKVHRAYRKLRIRLSGAERRKERSEKLS